MRMWRICITDCDGTPIGDPIYVKTMSPLTRLTEVRESLPDKWQAEAYPVVNWQPGFHVTAP